MMVKPDLNQILHGAIQHEDQAETELLVAFRKNQLTADEQEEVHLYFKAMGDKTPHAIYLRAFLYEYGYGVKADAAMAFLLMREAAAKGHANAIYEIGHRFLEGKGVTQNYQNALQWLEVAASSPHYVKAAMEDLSLIYMQGLGLEADPLKAKMWSEKAAQH